MCLFESWLFELCLFGLWVFDLFGLPGLRLLELLLLGYLGSFLILVFILAFTALEVAIAFIQAYIFTLLTCLYLSDAIHLH